LFCPSSQLTWMVLQATSMLSYSGYKLVLILYSFAYIAPGSII
jgi:hypothetical protein